jgi:hypothetical protein
MTTHIKTADGGFEILNDLRPTIVTTNWTIRQIREWMDKRIPSRLSGFVVLALPGKDRRKIRVVSKTKSEAKRSSKNG